jgi:hypothetical protein
LRIRTTNDSTGLHVRASPYGGAVVISAFIVNDINYSQRIVVPPRHRF